MDTSTEATGHHHRVGRTSLRPRSHRYLPRLERRSRRFSPGSTRFPVLVLAVPHSTTPPTPVARHTPTTGISEAPEGLTATPNSPAPGKGPEAPSAAPELTPTRTSTCGETMLPGESHEWQDDDGEALFMEPPKKKGKVIYGRLELKPPDSAIPEFGGGSHRKRYPSEFKLNAIE